MHNIFSRILGPMRRRSISRGSYGLKFLSDIQPAHDSSPKFVGAEAYQTGRLISDISMISSTILCAGSHLYLYKESLTSPQVLCSPLSSSNSMLSDLVESLRRPAYLDHDFIDCTASSSRPTLVNTSVSVLRCQIFHGSYASCRIRIQCLFEASHGGRSQALGASRKHGHESSYSWRLVFVRS
jgi:hypothetical protein